MSDKSISFLLTQSIELVYRILDHLDELTILLSVRDICTQLNVINDAYRRYKVNYTFKYYSFQ
jgi:hypothetical protein